MLIRILFKDGQKMEIPTEGSVISLKGKRIITSDEDRESYKSVGYIPWNDISSIEIV